MIIHLFQYVLTVGETYCLILYFVWAYKFVVRVKIHLSGAHSLMHSNLLYKINKISLELVINEVHVTIDNDTGRQSAYILNVADLKSGDQN